MFRRVIASLALAAAAAVVPAVTAEAAHKSPRPLCGETISCPAPAKPAPLCGRPSEPQVCPSISGRQSWRAASRHVWNVRASVRPHRAFLVGVTR